MKVDKSILAQLKGYEAAATPGPWTALGHELYYGKIAVGVTHQQIPTEADARLIAVMRSWIKDIIGQCEGV